jgi:hypothetical protein
MKIILFIQDDEPETIRHELILDEADWGDEDEPMKLPIKPAIELIDETEIIDTACIAKPVVIAKFRGSLRPVIEKHAPQPAKDRPKEEVLTINERMSAKMAEAGIVAEQTSYYKIATLKSHYA